MHRADRADRALLSFTEAPKIGNRFMKFALDQGQFFKPGARRWAFAFMGAVIGGKS
jgi:hypothetical protein